MKWRTALLASALVVVPLVATFSHLIPGGVRRAAARGLWQPVRTSIAALFSAEPEPAEPLLAGATQLPGESERPGDQHAPAGPPAAAHPPLAGMAGDPHAVAAPTAGTTPTAVSPVSYDEPTPREAPAPAATAEAPRIAASPQVVTDALVASTRGGWTRHVAGGPASTASPTPSAGAPVGQLDPALAAERDSARKQLADLGAVGFEFAPPDAESPRYRCSCRLPADPSGQLQRVFQAAHEDPAMAMGQLLTEVRAWQRRSAGSASAPGATTAAGTTLRR